jgi:hypothetical protein
MGAVPAGTVAEIGIEKVFGGLELPLKPFGTVAVASAPTVTGEETLECAVAVDVCAKCDPFWVPVDVTVTDPVLVAAADVTPFVQLVTTKLLIAFAVSPSTTIVSADAIPT